MKTIASLVALAAVAILAGCVTMTPTQNVALANAAAGNSYAIYVLDQNGAAAIPTLTLLATQLPLIPQGKVSSHDVGVLEGQLQQTKGTISAQNPKLSDQVASLINLVAQAQVNAAGGNIDVNQAVLFAACQDVANGINNGVQYWEGVQSTKNAPSAVAK